MTIVVLGSERDAHVHEIERCLRSRQVEVAVLESEKFPWSLTLSHTLASGSFAITLPSGRKLDWQEVHSAYWRSYDGVAPSPLDDTAAAGREERDATSLFESLLLEPGPRWINEWAAVRLHWTKPAQLARIVRSAETTFPVPATLVSNDEEALRAFAAEQGACIVKNAQGGDSTRPFDPATFDGTRLRRAPVTVQRKVQGDDVRVYVIGEQVFACTIQSAWSDYREDPEPRITSVQLDGLDEVRSRRVAAHLGLAFTALDLRRDEDGQLWFLEANPSPMFLGFERRTGQPLTAALIDLLMSV